MQSLYSTADLLKKSGYCREELEYGVTFTTTDTHPRICLRVGCFISPYKYKAMTDRVAQFSIEFVMSLQRPPDIRKAGLLARMARLHPLRMRTV